MSMPYSCQLEHQMGLVSLMNRSRIPVQTHERPFCDRVTAINLRALIADVFRSLHLRLDANLAVFRMELECNSIVWFPQRLRQILETLVSNSLLCRGHSPGESRVSVYVRRLYPGYELRVTDNTSKTESPTAEGMQADAIDRRDNGLNVVRMLLAESDGELSVHGDKGHGTMSIAKLPVYCMGDFLESPLSA